MFGGGGIILETGWNHRPARLNVSTGRYLGRGRRGLERGEAICLIADVCHSSSVSLFLIPLRVYV